MNKTETAKLLTIASMIDNRTVAPETVEAWHDVLGHLPYGLAKEAMSLHRRESTDYLMPAHITKNLPRVKLKLQTDIRAAKARGLIEDWPENESLSAEVAEALAAARLEAGHAASGYPSLDRTVNTWMYHNKFESTLKEIP